MKNQEDLFGDEWERLIHSTKENVRSELAELVQYNVEDCIAEFYDSLLNHPEAKNFLSLELVDVRLRTALKRWLIELFSSDKLSAKKLVATQYKIGVAHARIHLPIHLVMQGARSIKKVLRSHLQTRSLSKAELYACVVYTDDMIDLAIECMSQTFVQETCKEVEKDEAFRQASIGQDVSLEREVQRAALWEWGQTFLFGLCSGAARPQTTLEGSDFGLWFNHKGSALFHNAIETEKVRRCIHRIDRELSPAILATQPPNPSLLSEIQSTLDEIRFLMSELFKVIETVESGRDPLTKALNRRFLSTILSREVSLSLRRATPFSVLMIDVDHFKDINEKLGHVGGDTVLRNVAEILINSCRSSDFVFRYGEKNSSLY